MRPIHLADLEAAARALMCCPNAARTALARQLIARADAADIYRKRSRKPHPTFGTGTLMSAAAVLPQAPRPQALDSNALDALAKMIAALAAAQTDQVF